MQQFFLQLLFFPIRVSRKLNEVLGFWFFVTFLNNRISTNKYGTRIITIFISARFKSYLVILPFTIL